MWISLDTLWLYCVCVSKIWCMHRNVQHPGCPCVLPDAFSHFTVDPQCCPLYSLGRQLSSALPFLLLLFHPLLLLLSPPYLQDLSSLFLPCWLTSPCLEECLTLVSGCMWAVPAQKHAQLFLMSSSRFGLWASLHAVIGTCLGGQCGCKVGWKQREHWVHPTAVKGERQALTEMMTNFDVM